jgi:hypothetical protein
MTAAAPHERTMTMPFGYRVTFRWNGTALSAAWAPDLPVIRREKAHRKFLAAYVAARNEFLADIATMIGGAVLVLDPEGHTAIAPEKRH